jgi:serine protease Do
MANTEREGDSMRALPLPKAVTLVVVTLAVSIAAACTKAEKAPTEPPSATSVVQPATVTVTASAPRTSTARAPEPSTSTSQSTATEGATGWPAVTKRAAPDVVRIDVLTCDSRWMGSGFVVGDHLVMTANHVAAGASAITVQTSTGVTRARVVGLDPTTDSALLRTDAALGDTPLELRTEMPALGESLAVLGYPLSTYELRFTEGAVSGLHEPVSYNGGPQIDAMVTDSAINGGNSGGPALDTAGRVVGLVSGHRLWVVGASDEPTPAQGQGYLIPAADLARNLARWRAQPAQPLDSCGAPTSPEGAAIQVDVTAADPAAQDIARSLLVHGEAINTSNYEAAWQVFTPRMQRRLGGLDSWAPGLDTSFWKGISIQKVTGSQTSKVARTVLVTEQDSSRGHDGQTCSVWVIDYGMKLTDGAWLIDSTKTPQGPPTSC